MSVQNKALVASLLDEVWNEKNYDYLGLVVAPDHVSHNQTPCLVEGPDAFRNFVEMYHKAFPNVWLRVDFQVADGNMVVTHWTLGGSNTGEFMGLPPTFHNVEITGMQTDRIEHGKIVESWASYDLYGLMHQMELLPTLP